MSNAAPLVAKPGSNGISSWLSNTLQPNLLGIGIALIVIAIIIVGIKIIASGLGSNSEGGGFRKSISQLGIVGLGAIIIASAGGIAAILGAMNIGA